MAITMEELKQKAQRYDEALEKAKRLYEKGTITESLCHIFPELKESEDEKIRKEIIDFLWKEKIFLQEAHSSVENNPKYRFVMDAIAWLEKQGEKHVDKVDINIDKMVMDYTNECGDDGFGKPLNCMIRAYRQGLTDAICTLTLANKKTTDKVEQEPTKWSEEDECYMSECIGAIATKDGWSFEEKRKTKKWLESIKQRIGG